MNERTITIIIVVIIMKDKRPAESDGGSWDCARA